MIDEDKSKLQRTALLSKKLKEAHRKIKQISKEQTNKEDRTAEEYALNKIEENATDISNKSINKLDDIGRKSLIQTKENIYKFKNKVPTKYKKVNTVNKASKIATKASKKAFKSSYAVTKESVRLKQRAVEISKVSSKTAINLAKKTFKATIASIKALIAGTKTLITAIVAGGWTAVIIIIVICMIAFITTSVFGIFLSNEDYGNGQTINSVIEEINTEYENKINDIKSKNKHDRLEMSGYRAVWKDVLSIYAVKTNTDENNPQEVITMTDNKKQILKDIFWQMNTINHKLETKTEIVEIEKDDGKGNIITTQKQEKIVYLYITVNHKDANKMALKCSFNNEQNELLQFLLNEENSTMWDYLLYGISKGDGDIVSVALSQVGNVGGEPYWSWYGFNSRVEWCACFVSWCANECGYIENGVLPKFASCRVGYNWFKERGQWRDRSYMPKSGDIIFFDWEGDLVIDHVGIVEKQENGLVYTIEGNSSDECKQNSYSINSRFIFGYGIMRE